MLFLPLLLALTTPSIHWPGKYNDVLSIGDVAPKWKDLPATDDKKYSFENFQENKLLLVIFTCNSCPCAVDYEERIDALIQKYGNDLKVVAINVNTIAEDSMEKMKQRAKDKNFRFVYLFDESQKIAKAYGAEYTPEFFLLNAERKVAYMGAMDDNSDLKKVKEKFLELAIDGLLKNQPFTVKETLARGCKIRYQKQRR